jgi:molybdopterin-guanine dinucleotide biosynthesis protein A
MQNHNIKMNKLLAIVMCGGESRRMGTDKGLLKTGNVTWVQLAYQKLSALGLPVVVSVDQSQLSTYQFNAEILIADSLQLHGPLNGILSVHNLNRDADLLLLACDMTDMKPETLQTLKTAYETAPGFDFYAYYHEGFFEPLCAIYTATALAGTLQQYTQGQLTNYSLQNILNHGNTKKMRVTDVVSFHNFNHSDELLP